MYKAVIGCRPYKKTDEERMLRFLSSLKADSLKFFDRLKGDNPIVELSKEEYHKIIGLLDSEIVAFGYLWENKNYPNIPSLGIVIRDDWQGIGIGQWFMSQIIGLGKILKVKAIYLSVHPDNHVAVHIYKKLGWKVIGKRKDSPKLEMLRELYD